MGRNYTNLLIHSVQSFVCVHQSKAFLFTESCVGLLSQSCLCTKWQIQESNLLYCVHYLTLLLKYMLGRKHTAEAFFGLKKFPVSKRDKIPRKMFSHLEFWASNRLAVSLSVCEWVHSASRGVLVSAGIELICFLVAGTVVQFGLSMRIILIIQRWLSCCSVELTKSRTSQSPMFLQRADTQAAWPGQLTWTGWRDIPYQEKTIPVYTLGRVGWNSVLTAGKQSGRWSAGGEQSCVVNHLFLFGFIPLPPCFLFGWWWWRWWLGCFSY